MNTQDRSSELPFFEVMNSNDLWKEFKKHMYPGKKTTNFYDYRNGDLAAGHGYFGLIKENKQLVFTSLAVDMACGNNHLEIAKHLYYTRFEGCTILAMGSAIYYGYLEVVKWLHFDIRLQIVATEEHTVNNICAAFMSSAGRSGNLEMVEFLYNHITKQQNYFGIKGAIKGDHPDTVKWLLEHSERSNLNTEKYLMLAIKYGRLEIVELLFPFITDNITLRKVMTYCVSNNNIEIISFIHTKMTEIVEESKEDPENFIWAIRSLYNI